MCIRDRRFAAALGRASAAAGCLCLALGAARIRAEVANAAGALGAPYALQATQGRSPSLLNGHLADAAPLLVLATLGMIAVELKTLDQVYGLTSTGKTINSKGDLVMKSYVPGDLGFDPLNLKPEDPEEKERIESCEEIKAEVLLRLAT